MIKEEDEPIHIPIDGTLDLHMFAPGETGDLVEEYLWACMERGIREVRIIHGKGRGVLRRKVHSLLERHPMVENFRLDSGPSGWGATIARLKKANQT